MNVYMLNMFAFTALERTLLVIVRPKLLQYEMSYEWKSSGNFIEFITRDPGAFTTLLLAECQF